MNEIIHSYKSLRKTVGIIGLLLPFALSIGGFLFKVELQPSISYYYYTVMRNLFVGSLCAISLFLFFYAGYDKTDDILGNFAGFFALGVAFFPTAEGVEHGIIGYIHLFSASSLFYLLSIFSFFRFTKGDKKNRQKLKRNIIYRICGIIIFLSITSLFIYFGLGGVSKNSFVFFMEAIALFFFGLSWLTKGGDLFFKDKFVRIRPYRRKKYLARN